MRVTYEGKECKLDCKKFATMVKTKCFLKTD